MEDEVDHDPHNGVYVAPNSAPTGASGAWVRIYDGALNPEWFDDANTIRTNAGPAIQRAMDMASYSKGSNNQKALRGGTVRFPQRRQYQVGQTPTYYHNVEVDLNFSTVRPISGKTYTKVTIGTTDYPILFLVNAEPDGAGGFNTLAHYSGFTRPEIRNGYFLNDNSDSSDSPTTIVANMCLFLSVAHVTLRNFYTSGFWQTWRKVQASGSDNEIKYSYIDQAEIINGEVVRHQGSFYAISFEGIGDNVLIDNVKFEQNPGTSVNNFIQLRNCRGGRISRWENGNVLVSRCDAVTLTNFHVETGWIRATTSGVTIADGEIWRNDTYQVPPNSPIVITGVGDPDADKPPPPATIRNVAFVCTQSGAGNGIAGYTDERADIRVDPRTALGIDNVSRRFQSTSGISIGNSTAARVSIAADGSLMPEWEDVSASAARHALVSGGVISDVDRSLVISTQHVVSALPSTQGQWLADSGTYHYAFNYLFRSMKRLVGASPGELKSVATVKDLADPANSRCAYIAFSTTLPLRLGYANVTVRVYRGPADGQYTHYVDVPAMGDPQFHDLGTYLSSGERWIAYPSARAADTISTNMSEIRLVGPSVVCKGVGKPAYGVWAVNDYIMNTAPSLQGTAPDQYVIAGWRCIGAGTPATWVEIHEPAVAAP